MYVGTETVVENVKHMRVRFFVRASVPDVDAIETSTSTQL